MAPFGGDVRLRAAGSAGRQEAAAPSAFTAAFGRLTPSKAAAAAAGGAGPRRVGGGAAAAAAAKELLDVPSHVLPSVLTLCPAFLRALLEASEPCA